MTPQEEAAFEKKAEAHFKSYREIPNGRTFLWNKRPSKQEMDNYRSNYDRIFRKGRETF